MAGIQALWATDKAADALTPEMPEIPPIPTAPELDTSAQDEREEAMRKERERRALSGRASTILTGGLGDTSKPQLGSAILLGQ